MKITIPFQDHFASRMMSGSKTATTRTKKYGKVGDTFEAFGMKFELLAITRLPLFEVANLHYESEGFTSRLAFAHEWTTLHTRAGFRAKQIVHLHDFQMIDEALTI